MSTPKQIRLKISRETPNYGVVTQKIAIVVGIVTRSGSTYVLAASEAQALDTHSRIQKEPDKFVRPDLGINNAPKAVLWAPELILRQPQPVFADENDIMRPIIEYTMAHFYARETEDVQWPAPSAPVICVKGTRIPLNPTDVVKIVETSQIDKFVCKDSDGRAYTMDLFEAQKWGKHLELTIL